MYLMFLYVAFAFAYNFCVEKSFGSCNNTCKRYQKSFKNIFNSIPTNSELKESYDDGVHNIYIADNVDYTETEHNLIFCDPSNYLIYPSYISTITINNDIIANGDHIKSNIPILFDFKSHLELQIQSPNKSIFSSIILQTNNKNSILDTIFLTDDIPKNIFQISPDSQKIQIYEMTNKIKTLFSNTSSLIELNKTYYCITDKQNGCHKYNNQNLQYITSAYEITQYPNVIIVDSTLPQLFISKAHNYVHIICEPGSDITYYPIDYKYHDFYSILHDDSIEMKKGLFTGEGNFTIINEGNLYLHSTTNINKFHFTIKSRLPLDYQTSRINSYEPNSQLTIEPKINVAEFCVLHGNKNLSGLFNSDKFIPQDTIIETGVTKNSLKEYPYSFFSYYFRKGTHNIPVTFRKRCSFHGNKKTNFIFNDVHDFSYDCIDKFISVLSYNRIIINPSNYFTFKTHHRNGFKNFIINVSHNFTMTGTPYFISDKEREEDKMNSEKYGEKKYDEKKEEEKDEDEYEDENEIDKDKDEDIDEDEDRCQIIGNGTISFVYQDLMEDIKYFCKIQPTVKLQKISSRPNPYICVGQANLDECKSKISNISSIKDSEWVWYRTMDSYHHKNTMYVTDNQILKIYNTKSSPSNDIYLTSNVHLTLLNYELDNNFLKKYIKAQDKSVKITVIYDNYYYSYDKRNTYIYDHNVPKNLNFEIYFYCASVRLYTLYVNDYKPNSIKLKRKCIIYIREPIHQIKNIFNYNNEIHFVTNTNNDYKQICYANQINECTNLSDFIFTNNYTELLNLESSLRNSFIYLCKDISFNISSWSF